MPLWSRKRNPDREAAEAAERVEAAHREAAKRAILKRAAQERRERDQAFPPEHRSDEAVDRRAAVVDWNGPTRWVESPPLTLGQRYGYQVGPVLAQQRPLWR